jgi:RNA polymerase sigma-70 factor (ECF subfamily)
MKEPLDDELFNAFTRGEPHAFKAIFQMFLPQIQFFASELTLNRQEAEDITSITFAKLFRRHASFANASNIKAFLYITTRNHCLDYLRQEKRRKTYPTDFSDTNELDEEFSIEEAVIEQELITLELMERIVERIQKLPDQCGRIFRMTFYDGKSTQEIAKALDISPETVRSQKRRALELLRMGLLDKKMEIILIVFCFYFFRELLR